MSYDLKIQGAGGKKILVIGCVHGDELIGQKVIKHLRQLKISGGTLTTVIAHTKAIKAKKRFIDQDLNRSFPGKAKGNHEEQLALSLLSLVKKADIVLDIHSTTTDTTSAVILTKVNPAVRKLLATFNPKRVVLMEKKVAKTALTGYCKAGISFEYGKDKNQKAFQDTLADILKILTAYGLIKENKRLKNNPSSQTEYFQVLGNLKRPAGFKLSKTIKNFSLVRKGELIASLKTEVQKSSRDFYPLLFGPISYKEIWGFMAKKVKSI